VAAQGLQRGHMLAAYGKGPSPFARDLQSRLGVSRDRQQRLRAKATEAFGPPLDVRPSPNSERSICAAPDRRWIGWALGSAVVGAIWGAPASASGKKLGGGSNEFRWSDGSITFKGRRIAWRSGAGTDRGEPCLVAAPFGPSERRGFAARWDLNIFAARATTVSKGTLVSKKQHGKHRRVTTFRGARGFRQRKVLARFSVAGDRPQLFLA